MWCSTCQQDVPQNAAPDGGANARCPRCRREFSPKATGVADATNASTNVPDNGLDLEAANSRTRRPSILRATPPPIPSDNWQLDRDLRAAERLVRQVGARPADTDTSTRRPVSSVHASHGNPPAWHAPAAPSATPAPYARKRTSQTAEAKNSVGPKRTSFLAWMSLTLGLTTFACGAVLLVWSFVVGRDDLWSLGLPLTLAGQAGLVIGLILQLDGLWQSNRETSDTLQNLDGQLDELRHATTMLSTTHSAPGQSFYAHIAEGAGPELLLADLKGQLDLLAMKISSEKRA